jgi:hypothetical protein
MPHCRRYIPTPPTRRDMLARCACGFGGVALTALMAERAYGNIVQRPDVIENAADPNHPFAVRRPHHRPAATSVIFLYMDGGPSQIDSFDPKPRLDAENGQPFKMKIEPTQFNNNGATLASPWKFRRYGQSGIPVSDLFPHVAKHVDNMAVIRSMTSEFPEHTSANYFLHTGLGLQGRPSMGSWVSYGLGSECQDLPGFVVLNGGLIPPGGLENFGCGFLPATYQASIFKPTNPPVANVNRREADDALQRNKLRLMRQLDRGVLERMGSVDALESAIANYEMAYRMQSAVPELMDLSGESEATKQMYGLDHKWPGTQTFGRQCLVARRLVERGVRFIELTCPGGSGDRWDQHGNLKDGHEKNALSVDHPIGALLTDLKSRGLLESTLVIWMGEFGRTPFAQGSDGRDHNPFGFSLWMAGGGVRGGTTYGATDEYGYKAVENKLEMHDLHATMLHLLGIEHTRLTMRFSGRDMRLTDVFGHVIRDVVA